MSAVLAERCTRCERPGPIRVRGRLEWGNAYRLCADCYHDYRSLQLSSKALEGFGCGLWRQAPPEALERMNTTFSRI